jgi:hypothetical protein
MGKALLAIGSFLTLCLAVLAAVVFFTRHEDRIAVDALLAERLSKAVVTAEQEHTPLDLRDSTPFDWDRVIVYPPGTPRATVSQALGFEFKGDLNYTAESSEVFVFTNNRAFVRFADYRGRDVWQGLRRPIAELGANDAVFSVRGGVVTPQG